MSNDPMESDDPKVRDAQHTKEMDFVMNEMRKDREAQLAATNKALKEQKAPQSFGGIDAGGITSL